MTDRHDKVLSVTLTLTAVVLAGTAVYRTFSRPQPPAGFEPAAPEYVKNWRELLPAGIRMGNKNASISIIEFSDFECPFCKRFASTLKDLRAARHDDVAIIFIHYPLDSHRFARLAARVAECAAGQGLFPRMQDLLFEKQDSLGLIPWTRLAVDVGIHDTSSFSRCAADSRVLPRVEVGLEAGRRINVRGTPTVLVNGWRLYGTPTLEQLLKVIQDIEAGRSPARGMP